MKTIIYKLLFLTLSISLLLPLVGCSDESDTPLDPCKNHIDLDNNGVCDECKNSITVGEDNVFVPEDKKIYFVLGVKDFGKVIVELLPEYAPVTVEHFISVVESDFYPGTTFHRILSDFMIQGGAPQNNSPSVDTVIGEFAANGYTYNTLAHDRGVISMARTPIMDSATSQFFICNADYPSLDGQYAAFGRVVVGMDVVDAITEHGMQYTSHSLNGMIYDQTKQPVIESAEIIDKR